MIVENMNIPRVKSTFFKIRGWTINPWKAYLLQMFNECTEGTQMCDSNADCTNTFDSYDCTCATNKNFI